MLQQQATSSHTHAGGRMHGQVWTCSSWHKCVCVDRQTDMLITTWCILQSWDHLQHHHHHPHLHRHHHCMSAQVLSARRTVVVVQQRPASQHINSVTTRSAYVRPSCNITSALIISITSTTRVFAVQQQCCRLELSSLWSDRPRRASQLMSCLLCTWVTTVQLLPRAQCTLNHRYTHRVILLSLSTLF